MTTKNSPTPRAERASHLRWVQLGQMRISPKAQREFRQAHAEQFASDFDLEGLGFPVVNHRDGHYYVVDGQHRIAALRIIGFEDTDTVQCETYDGLSEAEEAELFLRRDNRKAIPALDKFRIAITAEREIECDIDRIIRANGCVISRDKVPGGIRSVGTLRKVYVRSDPETLGRTIRLIRDSFGDPGFEASVIDGISLLCQRYNGQLEDPETAEILQKLHGGVHGLLNKAETLRRSTGSPKGHCVAAATVDVVNAKRRGKKLPSWWKS